MHVQESNKDTIVVFMSDNGGNNFPKIEPNKPLRNQHNNTALQVTIFYLKK
jgi:hypothetical protein